MRSVVALLAAVNPAVVALALRPPERIRPAALAAALAALIGVVVAAASEPILDALDVTPETFRIGAGVVLGVAGLRWLVAGASAIGGDQPASDWSRVAVPLLIPVLLTPQLVAVSLSVGADDGTLVASLGVVIGMLLAAIAATTAGRRIVWEAAARFVGAIAVIVALALIVDGVRAV